MENDPMELIKSRMKPLDERNDRMATKSEACKEYAEWVGAHRVNDAWILTDYDTWEPNPFYQGPPVTHPEYEEV